MAEVEELELRHDLALLAELVEIGDERPRVAEHVVAEVGGAHRQAARVGGRVEHLQPGVERVVDRAAGGELDDQVGPLAQGRDGVGEALGLEGRAVVVVADVDVDHRGAGRLALLGGGDGSASVVGSWGQSALVVSAPVGATVMSRASDGAGVGACCRGRGWGGRSARGASSTLAAQPPTVVAPKMRRAISAWARSLGWKSSRGPYAVSAPTGPRNPSVAYSR